MSVELTIVDVRILCWVKMVAAQSYLTSEKVLHWTWDYWTCSAFETNLFCRLTWLTTESTSCYYNGVWNQGVNQELNSQHNHLGSQTYVITSIFVYTWQYSRSAVCYWRRIIDWDCWTTHYDNSTWNQSVSTVSLIPETAKCLLNCSVRSKHCSSSSECKTNPSFRLTSWLSTTGTGTSRHSSKEWNENVILLNVNQRLLMLLYIFQTRKTPHCDWITDW